MLICIITALPPLISKEQTLSTGTIKFSSDYTKASMIDDQKSLLLSGDAWIITNSTTIQADSIKISGKDSRNISCEGSVSIDDSQQGISLTSNKLTYDRKLSLLRIDGWAEMEDKNHGIIAKGAYLENSQQTGITLIQISVRIFKDTDDGPMVCLTDSALYDSNTQHLEMTGNSVVYWKNSIYKASRISIDLEHNEITLEGKVKGTIHE